MLSARQWKPGDVARVGVHRWMRVEGDRWVNELGSFIHGTAHVSIHYACRPLVVIDPEDREQVERLRDALAEIGSGMYGVGEMQAALRSLIADAKPAEPMGLGAVVEAIYDNRFVRMSTDDGAAWQRVSGYGDAGLAVWNEIAVVRVLSEGVTA